MSYISFPFFITTVFIIYFLYYLFVVILSIKNKRVQSKKDKFSKEIQYWDNKQLLNYKVTNEIEKDLIIKKRKQK